MTVWILLDEDSQVVEVYATQAAADAEARRRTTANADPDVHVWGAHWWVRPYEVCE